MDTIGLLLTMLVTAADLHDREYLGVGANLGRCASHTSSGHIPSVKMPVMVRNS